MVSLLYPKIKWKGWRQVFCSIVAGALIAGLYGVVHDQITYSISQEYFTKFKFIQFADAKPRGGSPRFFVGVIGFLATWWVGAIAGYFIGRLSIVGSGAMFPWKGVLARFGVLIMVAGVFGGIGFLWGNRAGANGYMSY